MAEAVGFKVIANLMTKLAEPAFHELCLMYGVKYEVMKLKDTLSAISATLLDADERKEKSRLIQDWIVKLNDAVYDADDLLDEFTTNALLRDGRLRSKVRQFFSCSNQVVFPYKISHEIKAIQEKFDTIAANMSKVNLVERLMVEPSGYTNHRETDSFILESEIIGREKDNEEIIKLIMSETNNGENVSIIPIVGIGGLGKTTLTQLVYSAPNVVSHFELRSYVCVSEDFEKKLLVKKILKSIATIDGVDNSELDQLQVRLREKLDGKRYLLVLDDVWNENDLTWTPIKNLLMGGAKGSKILVTTRSKRVATVMGTGSVCTFTLDGLNDGQSWSLFEKIAFRRQERVPPNLKLIGEKND